MCYTLQFNMELHWYLLYILILLNIDHFEHSLVLQKNRRTNDICHCWAKTFTLFL